jgi:serine O-acetyltransferase
MTSSGRAVAEGLASKLFAKNRLVSRRLKFDRDSIEKFLFDLFGYFYPHSSRMFVEDVNELSNLIKKNQNEFLDLAKNVMKEEEAIQATNELYAQLSCLSDILDLDVEAIQKGDPAATSLDEVILCYPGFFADSLPHA